jgi:hypothetical protein
MFSGLTRSRKFVMGAALVWLLVEFLVGPPFGSVRAILELPAVGLGVWVLLGALSCGVLVVELLRSIVRSWAAWTDKRHFQVVGLVAGGCGFMQVLGLVLAFHRAFA